MAFLDSPSTVASAAGSPPSALISFSSPAFSSTSLVFSTCFSPSSFAADSSFLTFFDDFSGVLLRDLDAARFAV